jgi:hypothetical protein
MALLVRSAHAMRQPPLPLHMPHALLRMQETPRIKPGKTQWEKKNMRRSACFAALLMPCLLFLTDPLLARPLAVTMLQSGGASVSLAWDASPSPNITGYKVYYGNASRSYGTPVTIGNVLTYTVTGLTPNTWYFAVTAFDNSGNESGYSNEVSATTYAPLTLAGPSVTNGTSGAAFSSAMTAGGGKSPCTFSINAGSLPQGLSLNTATGAITGTPTKAGTFNFTVKVTDSNSPASSVTQACTIVIAIAPPSGLRITSMSASLRWFGVVLQATTDVKASAILRFRKLEEGAGTSTVIATPAATRTNHRAVLYLPPGPAYWKYWWTMTDAGGTVVTDGGTFQTR